MTIRFLVSALAVLALAGCGSQTKPAAETSTSSATSSSATSSAASSPATSSAAASEATSAEGTSSASSMTGTPPPLSGEKPTKEFVIGKWGTNGDCAMAIELRPDGTSDGPFGNWAYSDGVISFPEEPDFKVNVTILDPNTMNSTNATSDKITKMTRCP